MKETTIFVYGSLKRGFPLHSVLATSKYLGTMTLYGYTLHSAGAFPYMIPCSSGVVIGELYRVDAKTLKQLDRIEQNGTLYERAVVGEIEGKEIETYLALDVQDTGFAEWKHQPKDIGEVVVELLTDGIDCSTWERLRDLVDCTDFEDYVRECEGKAYLSEGYYA